MEKQIIMNMTAPEKRVAVMENKCVVDFFVEQPFTRQLLGNIYKGRVIKVLPGMQAAFVDIGIGVNGYLHRDYLIAFNQMRKALNGKEMPSISALIHEGQEIIVQVIKESIGTKGPKLTEMIELPGRNLVYLPEGGRRVSVSKRIKRRAGQLQRIGAGFIKNEEGLIFRTNAEAKAQEELEREFLLLRQKWERIAGMATAKKPPFLIYNESHMLEQLLRHLPSEAAFEVIVDDYETYMELRRHWSDQHIIHYKEKEAIFSYYGIEHEWKQVMHRQVALKTGGFLVFDQTEALTVIDVNTGSFTGKLSQRETVVSTNIEAAQEIARQMRLRKMGGIILIDFINMRWDEDRQKVVSAFTQALGSDPVRTEIIGYTGLGLMEVARKKGSESLGSLITKPCPTCSGEGRVLSDESIAYKAERALWELRGTDYEAVLLELPRAAAIILRGQDHHHLKELEELFHFSIVIRENEDANQSDPIAFVGTLEEVKRRAGQLRV